MSDTVRICPNCGKESRATATFCTKCGSPFEAQTATQMPVTPGDTRIPPPSAGGPVPGPPPAGPAGSAGPPVSGPPTAAQPASPVPAWTPRRLPEAPPRRSHVALIVTAAATALVVGGAMFVALSGGGEEQPKTPSVTEGPVGAPVTAEPAATEAPVPTKPPDKPYFSRITGITLRDGKYVVNFEVFGFVPKLPGLHVHFFFNTVPPKEAGTPGRGPWQLYPTSAGVVGTSPFMLYGVADRPGAATQMCILVANGDHSVQQDTGNCRDLP